MQHVCKQEIENAIPETKYMQNFCFAKNAKEPLPVDNSAQALYGEYESPPYVKSETLTLVYESVNDL